MHPKPKATTPWPHTKAFSVVDNVCSTTSDTWSVSKECGRPSSHSLQSGRRAEKLIDVSPLNDDMKRPKGQLHQSNPKARRTGGSKRDSISLRRRSPVSQKGTRRKVYLQPEVMRAIWPWRDTIHMQAFSFWLRGASVLAVFFRRFGFQSRARFRTMDRYRH